MYLFPAIDLRSGQVVRLLKGEYAEQTTYGDDPLAQAKVFADAGATWLHVVDLDGARSGKPEHLQVIEKICQLTGLRVEVGGGIRNQDTIRQYIEAGVNRVILGTAALQNWDWFDELAHTPTLANKLVLGLDARKGKLAIAGWEQQLELTALEVAQRVSDWPLAAIVFTDIATDGTLAGPNVESTREIAEATKIPVVSSGGVGNLDHLRVLRDLPIQGAIVGRALYEGTMTIDQALDVLERGA
ncbi:1-(5-phosphoribosyl)-5-[(5-phosphoribosylamino)methylideneamino]imidazole-4-carboxamide isomerase [Planctomycetales bacterium ZRK34]|nr:1-(5-phosphoribosyl)-5-[(5-phosphoribosylamino)methylideneamino]imidazole-4-carboxamide isomerase [Planctomycetales bacterium ZRK34]